MIVLAFTFAAWCYPGLLSWLGIVLSGQRATDLLVSALGALFVGPSMAFVAYFKEFMRGYYIAVVLSVSVFLLIWFDNALYLLAAAA